MAAWNNLHTAGFLRCVVQCGPNLQTRGSVDTPEHSVVLVPRKIHARARCLVPEYRAVEREFFAQDRPGNAREKRILDPFGEQRIEFELLEFSVLE